MGPNTTLARLKERLETLTSLKRTKAHAEALESQIKRDDEKRVDLERKLNKERKDMEQLESGGIKAMFHKVLGDKETQLEKERQEYLDASLNYNAILESLELMEYELSVLRPKIDNIAMVTKEVEDLKNLRSNEIISNPNHPQKDAIEDIYNRLDNNIILKQEYYEAQQALESANNEVKVIYKHLRKAIQWGNSGSSHRNYKYTAVDRAKSHLARGQMALNRLRKEMLDIHLDENRLVLQLNDLPSFRSVVFTNFISDWIYNQKLTNSTASTHGLLQLLGKIKVYLEQEKEKLNDEYHDLILKRDEILLSE